MILNVNNAEFVNLAKTVTKNVGKDQSSQLLFTFMYFIWRYAFFFRIL